MDTTEEKSIRTVPFSGKKTDYTIWASRFLAYAQIKGCKKVLTGDTAIPAITEVLDPTTDKEKLTARKANDTAYSMLTMAVTDPVSFGAVFNAHTPALPDGNSHLAWTNLEKIFKSTNQAKRHELEQEFNSSTLNRDDKNPDEWFAELESIRLQLLMDFKIDYDDDKLVSHILYNIKAKGYDTTIAIIKRDINKGRTQTLDEVKDDIRQTFGQLRKGDSSSKSNQEKILVTREGKGPFKQFKGDCRVCGKKGHKANVC
jgi:hypothetical protein